METLKRRNKKQNLQNTSWAPQKPNGTSEWIDLWFNKPVIPTKIKIYETYNPGSCVTVLARSPNFEWVELWKGNKQENTHSSVINEMDLKRVDFLVDEIRLILDCKNNESYYEIDAVQLIGVEDVELSLLKKEERNLQQWATKASASTYYVGYPPKNTVGKPTTYPQYGDLRTAWSPATKNGTIEWLELKYKYPMIPKRIKIFETYNPGSCVKISGKMQSSEEWIVLWNGPKQKNVGKSVINEIEFDDFDFKVDDIRLELDCRDNKGYYQIDAVQVISKKDIGEEIEEEEEYDPQDAFEKIQKEISSMKNSVTEFIEFVPKLAKVVGELISCLSSERFLNPIKKLFEMFRSIPLENLKSYSKKAILIIKKFDEAVQNGDYLPQSKISCISVEMVQSLISGSHTGEKLNAFVEKMDKITSIVTDGIPIEFFDQLIKFISKYSHVVIDKFKSGIEKAKEFVEETKPLIDGFVQLMNPVEIFTSYFDHLDKDNDGQLSIYELADIGASLEFFKEKGMEKKQIVEQILEDSKKLVELVKSYEIKKQVMETIKEIDFNDISNIFEMLMDMIKEFDTNRFLEYIDVIKGIMEFINEYGDILKDIIDSQKSSVNCISILSFLFKDSEFLSTALDLLKDISADIDFGELFKIFTDFNKFILETELFRSTEMVEVMTAGKNMIQKILLAVFSTIRKIESLIRKAIERASEFTKMAGKGLDMLDNMKKRLDKDGDGQLTIQEMKTGIGNFLDNDGNGRLDISDLKGAKDKIFSGVKGLFGKK